MAQAQTTQEEIEDLPPSAKLVLKVLQYQGALTQKAIIEESMLSARTVRYALERLQDLDVVDEDIYFADARQNLYSVTDKLPARHQVEADGGTVSEANGTSSDGTSDGSESDCCAD